MRLVTLAGPDGMEPAAAVRGGELLKLRRLPEGSLPAAARRSMRELLGSGDALLDEVRAVCASVEDDREAARLRETGALVPYDGARLAAPVPDPGLILSAGMNYRAHLAEMKSAVIPATPHAFAKSSAAVTGPGSPIVLPRSNPSMVDWEGEFSAVIGRACHGVSAGDALHYVAGYTLINDVTARDWSAAVRRETGIMGPILAWERNLLGKQFPTFCPMGPAIVTKDEIRDDRDVRLTTTLNGTVMQDASTDDLLFGLAEIVSYYSRFYLLRPGDIVTTGSPAGVGHGRTPPLYMKAGDVVTVRVREIGELTNPVLAEATDGSTGTASQEQTLTT